MAKRTKAPREGTWIHSKRFKNQLKRMRDDIALAETKGAALQVAKQLRKADIQVGWKPGAIPDLPPGLDLGKAAQHRKWYVHAVADWLADRSRRDQKKDKRRFDIAATVVTAMGMIPYLETWGDAVEARQRWIRRRFSRLPRSAFMAGYIDVSLNRDPNHVWTWSLHEHLIVSVRAKSAKAAKTIVRNAFAPKPHECKGIDRPLLVRQSDYPVGYLAYATRTTHPFTVKTREAWIKDGDVRLSYRKLRGSQRHELVRNLALTNPSHRVLLGGLRQDGKALRSSRRGSK